MNPEPAICSTNDSGFSSNNDRSSRPVSGVDPDVVVPQIRKVDVIAPLPESQVHVDAVRLLPDLPGRRALALPAHLHPRAQPLPPRERTLGPVRVDTGPGPPDGGDHAAPVEVRPE